MNCPKCHQPLPANAGVCPHCGTATAQGPRPVRYFTAPKSLNFISVISIFICLAASIYAGIQYSDLPYWADDTIETILLLLTVLAPVFALWEAFKMLMRNKLRICADENGISGVWPSASLGYTTLSVEPFRYSYQEIEAVEGKNGRLRISAGGKWKTMLLDSPEELEAIIKRNQNQK